MYNNQPNPQQAIANPPGTEVGRTGRANHRSKQVEYSRIAGADRRSDRARMESSADYYWELMMWLGRHTREAHENARAAADEEQIRRDGAMAKTAAWVREQHTST